MVGIPIRPLAKSNWIMSIDAYTYRERGWFCINFEDHLQRGDDEGGIRLKLDKYLLYRVC